MNRMNGFIEWCLTEKN